jgi:hypothetical protein
MRKKRNKERKKGRKKGRKKERKKQTNCRKILNRKVRAEVKDIVPGRAISQDLSLASSWQE